LKFAMRKRGITLRGAQGKRGDPGIRKEKKKHIQGKFLI